MEGRRPCLERLTEYLAAQGVAFEVSHHPPRYTAQELAQVGHVPGRLVAKVVMLVADGRLVMVVVPATLRVNLALARDALGVSHVRLAQEEEFAHVFSDCEVGAMPPFGNLYGVPVYVDAALAQDPVIFFKAGTHEDVVSLSYAEFERLVRPQVGVFASEREAA